MRVLICWHVIAQYGAYQYFSVSPAATVIPLPDDLSFEDASTLPLAIFTAAIGLFVKLGYKPIPDVPSNIDGTGMINVHFYIRTR